MVSAKLCVFLKCVSDAVLRKFFCRFLGFRVEETKNLSGVAKQLIMCLSNTCSIQFAILKTDFVEN